MKSILGGKYHISEAEHYFPRVNLISFLPAVIRFGILQQLRLPSARVLPFLISPPFLFVLFNVFALTFPLASLPMNGVSLFDRVKLDFMGTDIAFSKDKFSEVVKLAAFPFDDFFRGYSKPALTNFGVWILMYIQHAFFRPGFLMSMATITSHLVLGFPNSYRTMQVRKILEEINTVGCQEGADFCCLVGDFNSPIEDPCFKLIHHDKFIDAASLIAKGETSVFNAATIPWSRMRAKNSEEEIIG